MILAGIDEAGYGPLLGPLVVGCAAFEVPGDPEADLPDLWALLKKMVGSKRCRYGKKLHVNDSKLVYSPSAGLKELERSLLAFATVLHGPCPTLETLFQHLAGHMLDDLPAHPFYHPSTDETFPLANDATALRLMANGLKAEMQRVNVRCVHLAGRVMLEQPLNRLFQATKNKSNTLFSIAAIHLDQLLRKFSDQGLVIFCDRQGGREHYGHGLRQMFEEWSLEIDSESPARSEYRLKRRGASVRIIFTEKAEAQCLPVALASMLCKYLREALMARYNVYWRSHLPDLKPTAGYHPDGVRFFKDIEPKMRELGISRERVVRSR